MTSFLLAYRPFIDPLRGGWNYWYLFLLPLSFLVALVYKAVRLDDLSRLLGQTLAACGKLLAVFIGCAILLWLIALLVQQ
jgi:hypothetical protein